MNNLGIRADAGYRTVGEIRMLEMLLLGGFACELRERRRSVAERETADALERWMGLGLPFARGPGGERCFDPVEVVNFMKWAGFARGDPFWEARAIATGRRMIGEFHGAGLAPPLAPSDALAPRRFSVTFERSFGPALRRAGARLRLPLPIEDQALCDLIVTPLAPADLGATFSQAPGRLDVRLEVRPGTPVTLGFQASFTAWPVPARPAEAPLTAAEVELYTRPQEGLIQLSPRIHALAAELAGTSDDASDDSWRLVERFWNFMLDRLTFGLLHYDQLGTPYPVDGLLDSGWLDCQLGSALLVGLCRARGIPARAVSGYLLYPAAPTYHYWAEAWIAGRGWLPLDLASAELSLMGRDRSWRNHFLGRLDYRLKTQCLPRLFTGTVGLSFPPVWQLLTRATKDGAETGIFHNAGGDAAFVHRDRLSVATPAGPG